MTHMTLKTREREVGEAVENVAKNGCAKIRQAENENAVAGNNVYCERKFLSVRSLSVMI